MKLKDFANNINKLLQKRPETAEFEVVTSKDEEGNEFDLVYYSPTVGNYNSDDKDFSPEEGLNAVCIN